MSKDATSANMHEDHDRAFDRAIMTGDVAKVSSLLAIEPQLTEVNEGSPLRAAAFYGHLELVRALLVAGANPDTPMLKTGWTPLLFAEFVGHDDIAKILREHGAQQPTQEARASIEARLLPSCEGSDEGTMLLRAAQKGDLNTIRSLLAKDANLVRATSGLGYTALHYASQHGHADVAQLLLARGADVNAETRQDESPLAVALEFGHHAIAQMLEEVGGLQLP